MARVESFSEKFRALTGFDPMPWQEALYERFVAEGEGDIAASCNPPAELEQGKASMGPRSSTAETLSAAQHSRCKDYFNGDTLWQD